MIILWQNILEHLQIALNSLLTTLPNRNIYRKAVPPHSNILSCWADYYGSIDPSNINIGPLIIIFWQNILGQKHVALNSLLTTLPNRNIYRENTGGLIFYYSRINIRPLMIILWQNILGASTCCPELPPYYLN